MYRSAKADLNIVFYTCEQILRLRYLTFDLLWMRRENFRWQNEEDVREE